MTSGTISLTIPKLKNMEEGLVSLHWLVTTCITPSFPFSTTKIIYSRLYIWFIKWEPNLHSNRQRAVDSRQRMTMTTTIMMAISVLESVVKCSAHAGLSVMRRAMLLITCTWFYSQLLNQFVCPSVDLFICRSVTFFFIAKWLKWCCKKTNRPINNHRMGEFCGHFT